MRTKIIQLITREDTETYNRVVTALKLYDEYLHSNNNVTEAIKVRKLLGKLSILRTARQI
jgi:hypothetical protein